MGHRTRGLWRAGSAAALVGIVTSCVIDPVPDPVVLHPDGYGQLAEGETTRLMSSQIGRFTWKAWEIDGPGRIDVEVSAYASDRDLSSFDFDVEFRLDAELQNRRRSLVCSTRPQTSDPSTRLRCGTPEASGPAIYRMAPKSGMCTEWALAQASDREFRDCWLGELVTPGETYSVEFSFLERWETPMPPIVWRDQTGRAVQSSEPATPRALPVPVLSVDPPATDADGPWVRDAIDVRLRQPSPADADTLMLNALAIHVWFEMLVRARQRMRRIEYGVWS